MKIDINKINNSYHALTYDDSEVVKKDYFNDQYGYEESVVFKKAFKSEDGKPDTEKILNVFNCWLSEDKTTKTDMMSEEKEMFSNLNREEFNKGKWNALASGKRLWLVYPSAFNSEISNNLSKYQPDNLEDINRKISENAIKPFYAIQEPGELIYIPGSNYHMHINLEDTDTFQQEFINEINYDDVRIAIRKFNIEDFKHLEKTIKSQFEKLSQSDLV
ncbi:hypothetical protein OWR28_00115 [Chryseobacterium sp. 1B4]